MKVFLSPSIGLHSPAMVRIANALTKYLPEHYQVVHEIEQADLAVLYPIGIDWIDHIKGCIDRGQEYALIQCCYRSSGGGFDEWKRWWDKAVIIWSYLNLLEDAYDTHGSLGSISGAMSVADFNYYEAPLGIDETFTLPVVTHPKRDYIVTTGMVHGRGAEAILECWKAAQECGLNIVHVGSFPVGIGSSDIGVVDSLDYQSWSQRIYGITLVTGCTDQTLRGIYQNAKYVCSLRYVEGFELPALEALSCGTRSIVFTQPATTKWYWGLADFVPECEGQELVDHLVQKFSSPYEPISPDTIDEVRARFNWGVLVWRFWSIVEKEMSIRQQSKAKKYTRGDGVTTCAECGIDINDKREGCTTCIVRSIEGERVAAS